MFIHLSVVVGRFFLAFLVMVAFLGSRWSLFGRFLGNGWSLFGSIFIIEELS